MGPAPASAFPGMNPGTNMGNPGMGNTTGMANAPGPVNNTGFGYGGNTGYGVATPGFQNT